MTQIPLMYGEIPMPNFPTTERPLSQLPALDLLIKLGYHYLPPAQALAARQGSHSNVILEDILRDQLKRINHIHHKGKDYLFSEENIQTAIQKLKNLPPSGLLKTNETVYNLLTLPQALSQTIEGDVRSFNLKYIDWKHWQNNVFHVTAEFGVEKTRSYDILRPDIVLFVNGIPFVVIECKSPTEDPEQAISQMIRNQSEENIPKLFFYTQLLIATNKNIAKYATVGTPMKFWGMWKEQHPQENTLHQLVNHPLTETQKVTLFSGEFQPLKEEFHQSEHHGERQITPQDKTLFNLCRPERLLELAHNFIVVDSGEKKIARYQQYFVIKSTLERVKHYDANGSRKGGIVWHTQGSGKSLTMVMLARNLALGADIPNPRIILVTDRDDLDLQLKNTFEVCAMEPKRATSGHHLFALVSEHKASIITTLIHKFDRALTNRNFQDDSPDIFVLSDESHRSHFGSLAARMRQMLPKACYLGFTGTPLTKEDKNNFARFGGLINPHYTMRQAVEDKAVVPLLYEARHVEITQDKAAIDLWFERHTQGLSDEQKKDLKKKYSRAEVLHKTDQVIYMQAFDISEHFRSNWQGTGFKAQLVARDKLSALKYHDYLNDIGYVSSEVIISPPDVREGYDEVDSQPKEEVLRFWKKMMARHGSEDNYNKDIINQFKNGETPEILIVVDKLITGFDVPRNTVLYLCRKLREHTLLQAIARVNRLHEGKEFGYIIDYASVLKELDKALTSYDELAGFDEADLMGMLTSVNQEVHRLPQVYSELWDHFKSIKNQHDEEAYERFLADIDKREEFYELLSTYTKTLGIALSAEQFIMTVPDELLRRYKDDLKRFHRLKAAVQRRYAEKIDYSEYEPKIKKVLNTHIQANEVIQLHEAVNIFDEATFKQMLAEQGVKSGNSKAAIADTIAHATRRYIIEHMDEDPAFYTRFSEMVQQAIDEFKAKRLSDLEYLNHIVGIRNKVKSRQRENVPDAIKDNDHLAAFYGIIHPVLLAAAPDKTIEGIAVEMVKAILAIFDQNKKVDFWHDEDAQKIVKNRIDDYYYDVLNNTHGITLSTEQVDDIIENVMRLAKKRQIV